MEAPKIPKFDFDTLDRSIDDVRASPRDGGELQLIVARPGIAEREALSTGELDPAVGLVGDNWFVRAMADSSDGTVDHRKQLTLMNSRVADAVAGSRDRWALAGDQLYIDLDLSVENLPPGTRLALGTALIEMTEPPHTGCPKFTQRFGADALKWVNDDTGRQLRMRGANAQVIEAGTISIGDKATKLAPGE